MNEFPDTFPGFLPCDGLPAHAHFVGILLRVLPSWNEMHVHMKYTEET